MFNHTTLKNIIGKDVALSQPMIDAINKWKKMLVGNADWCGDIVESLKLEEGICREFADSVLVEMEAKILNNDNMDAVLQKSLSDMNKKLQTGLALGAMVLYEAKQRQRQMETAMRAQREKVQMLQDGGADRQEVMLQKAKYQGQLNEYAAFSRKMGLKEERERIYIDGRGRIAPSQYDPKMRISIPDTVSKEARLSKEIEAKINAAIKKLDSEYIIYLDLIESEALEKGDIFVTGAYLDDEGILRHSMVINRRRNFENIEMQMRSRYNKGVMAGRNFEDYIAHEMAHIMPFQNCITAEEYMELNAKIKSQFIKGISKYADKKRDGRESLAEAFVRYRNGEVIPNEARKLIEKYILPWRRI